MASTYSTNLKLELIGTGEQSGVWGTTTNTNMGTAIEQAIVGKGSPVFSTDADLTLTLSNSSAAQTARAFVLNVTSGVSLTTTRNLVVPTIEKPYVVMNNTTGGQSIVVKTAAGSGITVPNGGQVFLYVDGTNVIQMLDAFGDLTYTGTLTGGTGVVNLGSGQFVKAADGTVGVGRVPSGYALDVGDTASGNMIRVSRSGSEFGAFISGGVPFFGSLTNNAFAFMTNGTERARIDTSGNLLVGTTSFAGAGLSLGTPNASGSYSVIAGSGTGFHWRFGNVTNGIVGSISTNATTTTYSTTSDHRLKTNVRPADAKRFSDIEFVDFEWIDGRHDCGLIAHQLQSVYPDLVYGEKDATEEVEYELSPAIPAVLDEEGNEVTPAVEAVIGTKTQPKYQMVNYIGLIARMGTVVQRHEKTIEAMQAQLDDQNTAMQLLADRLAALEAAA